MRIVIEIEGENVTIHRSDEALPPSELWERAAALGAESAGAAPVLGAEIPPAAHGQAELDAGAAPEPPRRGKAAAAPKRPRRRPGQRAR